MRTTFIFGTTKPITDLPWLFNGVVEVELLVEVQPLATPATVTAATDFKKLRRLFSLIIAPFPDQ